MAQALSSFVIVCSKAIHSWPKLHDTPRKNQETPSVLKPIFPVPIIGFVVDAQIRSTVFASAQGDPKVTSAT
jgi:hypothetical protein